MRLFKILPAAPFGLSTCTLALLLSFAVPSEVGKRQVAFVSGGSRSMRDELC